MDNHKGHTYVNFEQAAEEICNALMADTERMICELEKEKDDAVKIQLIVSENCRECASEVKDFQEYVITKINQKSERLLNYIEQHKNKSDSATKKAIDNIDQKIAFLKDFGKRSETIFEVNKDRLEQFKLITNDINMNRKTQYTMLNYAKCGDTAACLALLCGKIKLKEKHLEERTFDISTETTTPASASDHLKRSTTLEETPTIDGSYKPGGAPVPVVKDCWMSQSIASRKSEGSVQQPKNSPHEILEWANSLIAKAAEPFPRDTGVPCVTHGNSRASDLDASGNSIQPTETVNRIVGCKFPVGSTTWTADSRSSQPGENSVTDDQTYHNMDLCIRPKNAIITSHKTPSDQSVNARSSMAAQYYSDGVLQPVDASPLHSEALYESPINPRRSGHSDTIEPTEEAYSSTYHSPEGNAQACEIQGRNTTDSRNPTPPFCTRKDEVQFYQEPVTKKADIESAAREHFVHHPAKNICVFHTVLTNQRTMNNNDIKQPITSGDFSDEKSIGRSGDAREDEPLIKRPRLESEDDSTNGAQGLWKGKVC